MPTRPARLTATTVLVASLALAGCASAGSSSDAADPVAAPDGAYAADDDAGATADAPDQVPDTALAVADLEDLGAPPPLENLDGWLNNPDDIATLDDTRGRVTVVWFWTFGCFNCKNTLPNLQELRAAHPTDDVEIIGVHAPEFDHEADPDNIAQAVEDLGVTWPVALDTDHTTFRSWQDPGGNFWPRTFVLDQAGDIRFDHIGEGAYDRLNDTVAALVADPVA